MFTVKNLTVDEDESNEDNIFCNGTSLQASIIDCFRFQHRPFYIGVWMGEEGKILDITCDKYGYL